MNPATTSADALTQLQGAEAGSKSSADILASQKSTLGVQGAQDQVSGLRQAINNTTKLLNQVAPSVMGRTQNSLVTNAQATKQISNERAPLDTSLGQENVDYGNANADLTKLSDEATQNAGLEYGDQQNKLSYLQNLYNTLYGKEQDASKAAEAKREFDAQLAASTASSNGLASLFGGSGDLSGGTTAPAASGVGLPGLRVPGDASQGFAFRDSAGNETNALAYSQAQQIPFRTLLTQMAGKGDVGAKAALSFIGNDGNADPTKITSQALANLYHSLTGRYVAIAKAPSTAKPAGLVPINNPVTIPTRGGIPGII